MTDITDYYYGRALRRVMATPQDVQAIPSTEDITLQYVSTRAGEEEQAKSRAASREIGRERLKERRRQAGERLALKKESLRESRRQGKWATGISLANLALTGWGGYIKIKEAEKQEALTEKRIKAVDELMGLKRKYQSDLSDLLLPYIKRSWHQRLRPSYGMETM